MRQHLAVLALVGIMLSGPAVARGATVSHYTPIGPWETVDASDGCRVAREFVDGRKQVRLFVHRDGPGVPLTIGLTGNDIRTFRGARQARVSFRPGGDLAQTVGMVRTAVGEDEVPTIVLYRVHLLQQPDWETVSSEEMNRLAGLPHPIAEEMRLAGEVSTITVNGGLVRPVELTTGPLDEPMATLQACTDGMLRNWGLDPAVQNHLSRRVAPMDRQALIQAFDYPYLQVLNRQRALIRGHLIVGTDGQATQCNLIISSAIQAFNDETCRTLTSRAWFNPALDAAGNPVESYFAVSVAFGFN
jgi:hypothetical protein